MVLITVVERERRISPHDPHLFRALVPARDAVVTTVHACPLVFIRTAMQSFQIAYAKWLDVVERHADWDVLHRVHIGYSLTQDDLGKGEGIRPSFSIEFYIFSSFTKIINDIGFNLLA